MPFGAAKAKALEKLDRAVHDGVVFRGNGMNPGEYIAFAPTQIKSSTKNNGESDGTNPDISPSGTDRQDSEVARTVRNAGDDLALDVRNEPPAANGSVTDARHAGPSCGPQPTYDGNVIGDRRPAT